MKNQQIAFILYVDLMSFAKYTKKSHEENTPFYHIILLI